MPKYIFIYLGGETPASPEEAKRHFVDYENWLRSLGSAVVSPAIPFKDTHTVQTDGKTEPGTTTAMSGMSIIQMPTMDKALEAARSCPFLDIGGTLEVSEMVEVAPASKKPN